jgi:hypothetical protein
VVNLAAVLAVSNQKMHVLHQMEHNVVEEPASVFEFRAASLVHNHIMIDMMSKMVQDAKRRLTLYVGKLKKTPDLIWHAVLLIALHNLWPRVLAHKARYLPIPAFVSMHACRGHI